MSEHATRLGLDDDPVRRPRSRPWTVVALVVVGIALAAVVALLVGTSVLMQSWASNGASGQPGVVHEHQEAKGSPSDDAATAACPDTGDDGGSGTVPDGTSATCAAYDGEALMRSNEIYRERRGTPEGDARAATSLPAVQAALEPLVTGEPIARDDVVAALGAAGFDTAQVTPTTSPLGLTATSFGVGVSVPGGCVYGAVAPEGVTLEAGGPINDGGCLAMPAH